MSPHPACLLGIDLSTTAAKALLVRASSGEVVASASRTYPILSPRPLWCEQNQADWAEASFASIRQVLQKAGIPGEAVIGVGLTGQMHGLTLLDEKMTPLRPAILWNDQRTGEECAEIRRTIGLERLVSLTGNDAFAGFTAPKFLWVRKHEPEIYARARHFLLPKDYLRWLLTDEFATDCADAAGTLLLDATTRRWQPEILDPLGIPSAWLPEIYEGPQITGTITRAAAERSGLAEGTPVVGGAGDQSAHAIGIGAAQPGILAITMGTSGVMIANLTQPRCEPHGRVHLFCSAIPQRWHLMGTVLSAGGSLRWFRDLAAPGVDYADLLEPACTVPPGCEGLIFQPNLTGERTPNPDTRSRGGFVGLTVRHTRAHLLRAVLEGVAYGLRDNLEMFRQTGLADFSEVRVSGGGAKSALWRQILADVMGVELTTIRSDEGAAFGAALLAGVGAGVWQDTDQACRGVIQSEKAAAPLEENQAFYDRQFVLYKEVSERMKEISHLLR